MKHKIKIGNRGFEPLSMVVVTIGMFLMIILPTVLLKVQIIKILNTEIKYNDADSALLTLLSLTHEDIPLPQWIAEYIYLGEPSDISFLKDKLAKSSILQIGCVELWSSEKVIISAKTCVPEYNFVSTAKIVLPYNNEKLIESIRLVIV